MFSLSFPLLFLPFAIKELKAKVAKAKRDAERKIRLIRKMEKAIGSSTVTHADSPAASPAKN